MYRLIPDEAASMNLNVYNQVTDGVAKTGRAVEGNQTQRKTCG